MNRCIQCYRCVRFYRDYAGGKDLNVFGSRNHVYFGRYKDGTLENEFSGNLVEVCPTGVFTDKTLKNHFTRKWDMTNSPSVCVHCSVGCNTIVSERYGSVRRIMSRYNGSVNGYFICDRGRFGYEFLNSDDRIRKVQVVDGKNKIEDPDDAVFSGFINKSFSKENKIIGIGSPRASLESNFALSKLVGKDNFYNGIPGKEQRLTGKIIEYYRNTGVIIPSLKQIEKADCVLVLGADITNTAPMIALAIRQAIRNVPDEEASSKGIPLWNDAPVRLLAQDKKSPVFLATAVQDKLDDIAEDSLRVSNEDISMLGFEIAAIIDKNSPGSKTPDKKLLQHAQKIALSLKNAKRPLIVAGINCGDENIINAALNITTALQSSGSEVMLSMILPESNSMGLGLMGGKSLDDAVSLASISGIDTLIVLENDLYRRGTEESVNLLFEKSKRIIVLDYLNNRTTSHADLLLPSAAFLRRGRYNC